MPSSSGLDPVTQKFLADNSDTIAKIREIKQEYQSLVGVIQPIKIDADISGTLAKIGEVKAALGGLPDRKVVTIVTRYVTEGAPAGGSGLDPASAAAIRDVTAATRDSTAAARDAAAQARDMAAASYMTAMADRMRANTAREAATATDQAAASVEAVNKSLLKASQTSSSAAKAIQDYASSIRTAKAALGEAGGYADLAAVAASGGGAGGAGVAAALAAIGAGGGGGGGGPSPGTAAAAFAGATAFVKQWYPAFHWAVMLSSELLATVGPAAVAGGAAAAVGYQGGQQVYNRLQAVRTATEALGPAYGTSAGQVLTGSGALQQYQNQYTGGVYGLFGAGLNILGSKSGGQFLQLGGNTISMLDQAAAKIVTDVQQGLGTSIYNAVSGGTGYLQQFGDVAANIGKTFLNVAPNLPGVGSDLLSILQGGTGALASVTGHLGGFLGLPLAFEAAARYGPALVGGAGAGLASLGGAITRSSLSGTLGSLLGSDLTGVSTAGVSAGVDLTRAGLVLGGLTAPAIGTAGALAYLLGKGFTYQSPTQQGYAEKMTAIGNDQFLQAFGQIPGAMSAFAAVPQPAKPNAPTPGLWPTLGNVFRDVLTGNVGQAITQLMGGGPWASQASQAMQQGMQTVVSPGSTAEQRWQGLLQGVHSIPWMMGVAGAPATNWQVAQKDIQGLATSFVNVLGAGKQVQQLWQDLGGGAVNMAQAFQLASMANLDVKTAFTSKGALTPDATMQLVNFMQGYTKMMPTAGAVGSAISAQQAVGGLQQSQVAAVNSAYDQLTQIMSGGPAGTAALAGMLQATPASALAPALKSFTSPAGAAAWTTFASTSQPSVISTVQANLDNLRNEMVLGAVNKTQASQMAGYWLNQALPAAQQSPAAMAMLASLGAQFGASPYFTGSNQAAVTSAIKGHAATNQQMQTLMTNATIAAANVPGDATSFVQSLMSDISANSAQATANQLAAVTTAKGGLNPAALATAVGGLQRQGIPAQGIQAIVGLAMSRSGATQQAISAAQQQVTVDLKVVADTSQARSQIAAIQAVKPINVQVAASGVATATEQIQGIKGKTVTITAQASGVGAAQAAIDSVHGKVVDLIVNTIIQGGSVAQAALQQAGYAPGVSASQIAQNIRKGNLAQSGMLVPGYGGGDIFPAMLEPGETVFPKHATRDPLVAALAQKYRIPGFAGGGVVPAGATAAQIQALINADYATLDTLKSGSAASNAYWKNTLDPLYNALDKLKSSATSTASAVHAAAGSTSGFGFSLTGVPSGIVGGLVTKSQAQKVAQALVNQIVTEVGYANTTSSGILSGLNIAGMTVDPAVIGGAGAANPYGPNARGFNAAAWNSYVANFAAQAQNGPAAPAQSVQQQMQSYLQDIQQFQSDMGQLSKQGLNKTILQQLIGAGPVQGDALAQSILGGGGAGAVNRLYAQIGNASKGFGASAANWMYGGMVAPNLKSGSGSSSTVNININAQGNSNLGNLTQAQISQIVAEVQAALLKQARRNTKTGIQLTGRGA